MKTPTYNINIIKQNIRDLKLSSHIKYSFFLTYVYQILHCSRHQGYKSEETLLRALSIVEEAGA